jgi:hypothetical protein
MIWTCTDLSVLVEHVGKDSNVIIFLVIQLQHNCSQCSWYFCAVKDVCHGAPLLGLLSPVSVSY